MRTILSLAVTFWASMMTGTAYAESFRAPRFQRLPGPSAPVGCYWILGNGIAAGTATGRSMASAIAAKILFLLTPKAPCAVAPFHIQLSGHHTSRIVSCLRGRQPSPAWAGAVTDNVYGQGIKNGYRSRRSRRREASSCADLRG